MSSVQTLLLFGTTSSLEDFLTKTAGNGSLVLGQDVKVAAVSDLGWGALENGGGSLDGTTNQQCSLHFKSRACVHMTSVISKKIKHMLKLTRPPNIAKLFVLLNAVALRMLYGSHRSFSSLLDREAGSTSSMSRVGFMFGFIKFLLI